MRILLWISLVCLLTNVESITHLTNSHGFIKSPNFPREYANDVAKEWRIHVRNGYKVRYKFTAFDLEDSYDEALGGSCVYDYLMVTDGGEELQRFCGNPRIHHYSSTPRINYWYYSKNNTMDVKFVSDYSNEGISPTGFSVHYVETDIDECTNFDDLRRTTVEDWDELVTCNHFCINVPGTYYCRCRTGFELAPDRHTCVAKFCENRKLTALNGTIESPEYPSPYGKLSNCQWDINVPEGFSILMTFSQPFDIEVHNEEGCVYDVLSISYRDNSENYCGVTAPHENRTWDLNTRDVRVQFRSDFSIERSGFQLFYNTSRIKCYDVLKPPTNGSIKSANPGRLYHYEDEVTFKCDEGFDLIGHSRIECTSNGTWTHEEPTCKIKTCDIPAHLVSVKNSKIVDDRNSIIDVTKVEFSYLDKVTVRCNEWYEQITGIETWKCDHTQEWIAYDPDSDSNIGGESENIPVCRPKCGIKGALHGNRTNIGGTESKPHEWPWTVFLNFDRVKNLGANRQTCIGTVISSRYILTAAHCVFTTELGSDLQSADNMHAWLGVHIRTTQEEDDVTYATVGNIAVHPDYNDRSKWDSDVALLRLSEDIIMTDRIRPICLPSAEDDFSMEHETATGIVSAWGLFDAKSHTEMRKFLLHAEYHVVTNEQCLSKFMSMSNEDSTISSNIIITDNMFCAGNETGNQGTCNGDSGAPFMMKKEGTAIYYQLGLVSFGMKECKRPAPYTSFTKLNQAIVKWIMINSNELE